MGPHVAFIQPTLYMGHVVMESIDAFKTLCLWQSLRRGLEWNAQSNP